MTYLHSFSCISRLLSQKGVLVLTLIVALAGCKKPPAPEEAKAEAHPVSVETALASVHAIDTTITAWGTLTAEQGASVRIAPSTTGRLTQVLVREGDKVQKGQIVATLDNLPQQRQTQSAAAALSVSEAQAEQAELAVKALATDQNSSVQLARLTLTAAQAERDLYLQQTETLLKSTQTDYEKTKAGARPQEIAQGVQAVAQASATHDRAVTEEERVKSLFEKGIAPKRQLEDARTAKAVANAALETSKQQLSLLRAGARKEDLRLAELRVQQAKETLEQARSSGEAKVAQAHAALQQAERSVLQVDAKRKEAQAMQRATLQKRADLAAAQETTRYAELRSPISGIVTRRALNPGDMADPTLSIVEISDSRALNLMANLSAQDGVRVTSGMAVKVTLTDIPAQEFEGQTLSVGQIDPQTNLLSVRIAVSNPKGTLKAGGFASASIILRSNPRAIVAPKQAILTREGKTVLFVVGGDGVAHQREVMVGAEQDGLVEIVKGIASGEKVVRLGNYELTDGAKVEEAKPDKGGVKE